MQLDNIISRIVIKIGNKNNVKSNEVVDIVSGFYKGINHCINQKSAIILKIDFFGKFIYSEAYKKKKESLGGLVDFNTLEI